jgi:hypothetical protein
MEYKLDEYCAVLLALGACDSRAGTASREYAQRYPGPCHPDANVIRQLEKRLQETGNLTEPACVKAGRPRSLRTPATEDDITVECFRSLCVISS